MDRLDLGTKVARSWHGAVVLGLLLAALTCACIPVFRGMPGGDPRIPLHPRTVPINPMLPKHRPALDDTTEDDRRYGPARPDTTTEDSW